MASKSGTEKDAFSARETKLLADVMKCIKGGFTVDFDKLADVSGFKNQAVARVMWSRVKVKLDRMASGVANDEGSSGSAKKSAIADKKRKIVDEGKDIDDIGDLPSKMPSKSRKIKAETTNELYNDDVDIGIKVENDELVGSTLDGGREGKSRVTGKGKSSTIKAEDP